MVKKALETIERFEQEYHSARIEKMIYIPASYGRGVLTDYLSDLDSTEWLQIFPLVAKYDDHRSIINGRSDDDRLHLLIQAGYLGFIIECYIPIYDKFSFDPENGNPLGWACTFAHRISRFHAWNMDEIEAKIKIESEASFQLDILNHQQKMRKS